jgi:hypothetical protein
MYYRKQKAKYRNLFFFFILKASEESSRIRFRKLLVQIYGSGSKCHESGTLFSSDTLDPCSQSFVFNRSDS